MCNVDTFTFISQACNYMAKKPQHAEFDRTLSIKVYRLELIFH